MSLEKLPIELIYKIFNYLDYHDIRMSFSNINTYWNKIIEVYHQHEINFEQTSIFDFRLTSKSIQSMRILSLCLSNLDDSPGQFRLFLSIFSLKQFSHLENLELIYPSNSFQFNQILSDLHELKSLRSLSILYCQPASVNQQTFEILSLFLHQSSSLRRLYLSGCLNHLFDYSFTSSIEYFYFNENIFNTISLNTIANHMPYLKSLETAITGRIELTNFQHLTRMILTVFINLTNVEMKFLLNRLDLLEYFQITANGKQWFNGRFWEESLPKNLQKFHFNFCTQSIHVNGELIVETFRTEFWLKIKRWFIMLDYQMNSTMTHLYSLPFSDRQFYYRPTIDPKRNARSTMLLDRSYWENVKDLVIDLSVLIQEPFSSISSTHYFPNVSNLILSDIECQLSIESLFDFLQTTVDLNQVTQLKLGHFYHPDLIFILYKHMSKLSSLRITQTLINQLDRLSLSNISRLSICDHLTDIDRIYSMFPNLKYLSVKVSTFEDMKDVMQFLGKNLINVTYRHVNDELKKQFLQWLEKSFSNEIYYEFDQHMNLHLWLS